MQQSWIINSPLAQHVSGTIMSIFRSARPYVTAYGFQHLMLLAGILGSREGGCNILHTVHSARFPAPQDSSQQHQVLETIRGNIRSSTPEDGHNGARNMLS
jgi:hypothetical protein